MKFSLDRNQYVAKKLGILNGDTILDIGCRDMIFKKSLEGKFTYKGIDYQGENVDLQNSELINHNLEKGFPTDIESFDIINALDVLEHIENIHDVFTDLFKYSNSKIVIALPNMAYYKFRMNFLFKGILSKKYLFSENKILDRHRWIPNYHSIIDFINKNANKNWTKKKFNFIAERKRNFIFYYLEKILSYLFPNLFVYEIIYIFNKNKK